MRSYHTKMVTSGVNIAVPDNGYTFLKDYEDANAEFNFRQAEAVSKDSYLMLLESEGESMECLAIRLVPKF